MVINVRLSNSGLNWETVSVPDEVRRKVSGSVQHIVGKLNVQSMTTGKQTEKLSKKNTQIHRLLGRRISGEKKNVEIHSTPI